MLVSTRLRAAETLAIVPSSEKVPERAKLSRMTASTGGFVISILGG